MRELWRRDGIVRVPGFEIPSRCAEWCRDMDELVTRRILPRKVYDTPADPAILNDGGLFDHYVADGFLCRVFRDLHGVYCRSLDFVRHVTEGDVILSPYERSAVNVNRYDPPSGQMSAHRDSNPISALLYLTTLADGGTTFLQDGEPYRTELPRAGDLLLFNGRIPHRGDVVTSGVKVIALLNYYTVQDSGRPAGMDAFMYGV